MSYPTTSSASSNSRTSSFPSTTFRARLAGLPASARSRPLTFPLGSLLGFLLGLTAASVWGYTTLLASHRALADQTSASLARLEETRRSVQTDLVQRVGTMAVTGDELERVRVEVGRRVGRLEEERNREVQIRERIERRVVGLEEENLDLRRRLWRMGKYAKLDAKAAQELQRQEQESKQLLQHQQRAQRPYGGVLWTGRSQEGQRLV